MSIPGMFKENKDKQNFLMHRDQDLTNHEQRSKHSNRTHREKARRVNQSFDNYKENVCDNMKKRLEGIEKRLKLGDITNINENNLTMIEKSAQDFDGKYDEETPFRKKYLSRNNETVNDSVIQTLLFGIDGIETSSFQKNNNISKIRNQNEEAFDAELKKLEKKMFDLFEQEKKKLSKAQNEANQEKIQIKTNARPSKPQTDYFQNNQINSTNNERGMETKPQKNDKKQDVPFMESYSKNENLMTLDPNKYESKDLSQFFVHGQTKDMSFDMKRRTIKQERPQSYLLNSLDYGKPKSPKKSESFREYMEQLNNYKMENRQLSGRVLGLEHENKNLMEKLNNLERAVSALSESDKERSSGFTNNSRDIQSPAFNLSLSIREKKNLQEKEESSKNFNKDDLSRVETLSMSDKEAQIQVLKEKINFLCEDLESLNKKNHELTNRSSELENKIKSLAKEPERLQTYETQVREKEKEAYYWKEKCQVLANKYFIALKKLSEDNKKLRKEVDTTYKRLGGEIVNVLKQFEKPQRKSSKSKTRASSVNQSKVIKLSK